MLDRITEKLPSHSAQSCRAARLGGVGVFASVVGLGFALAAAWLADGWSALSTVAIILAGVGLLLGFASWLLCKRSDVALAAVGLGSAVVVWVLATAVLLALPTGAIALLILVFAGLAFFFGKG